MSEPSTLPLVEPDGEQADRVAALLRALGIVEITYGLNGSGDSGETSLEGARYRDGREEAALPSVAIGFRGNGRPTTLEEYLGDLAADLPEGDWVNNEGGYGTVSIFPFATDPGDRFCCDMTYRDGYDDDDEDDDDELDELDEPDEPPFGAITLGELVGSAAAATSQVLS